MADKPVTNNPKDAAPPRAVIYIQPNPRRKIAERFLDDCRDFCDRRGWKVVTFTFNPTEAKAMLDSGQVERIVVARHDHLLDLVKGAASVELEKRGGTKMHPGLVVVPVPLVVWAVRAVREHITGDPVTAAKLVTGAAVATFALLNLSLPGGKEDPSDSDPPPVAASPAPPARAEQPAPEVPRPSPAKDPVESAVSETQVGQDSTEEDSTEDSPAQPEDSGEDSGDREAGEGGGHQPPETDQPPSTKSEEPAETDCNLLELELDIPPGLRACA